MAKRAASGKYITRRVSTSDSRRAMSKTVASARIQITQGQRRAIVTGRGVKQRKA